MEWIQPLVLLMLAWIIGWGSWVTKKIFDSVQRQEYREDREKFFRKLDELHDDVATLNTNVAVLTARERK